MAEAGECEGALSAERRLSLKQLFVLRDTCVPQHERQAAFALRLAMRGARRAASSVPPLCGSPPASLLRRSLRESLEFAAAFLHFHRGHLRARRTVIRPCDDCVDCLAWTLHHRLDGAVDAISEPAGDAAFACFTRHVMTKTDTLNAPMDLQVAGDRHVASIPV